MLVRLQPRSSVARAALQADGFAAERQQDRYGPVAPETITQIVDDVFLPLARVSSGLPG